MPSFLFTAKDITNKTITDRITADDLNTAKKVLQDKGFSEITFFESETAQQVYDLWTKEGIELPPPIFPELELELFQTKHRSWYILKNNIILMIVFLLCIIWNIHSLQKNLPLKWADYVGFLCSISIVLFSGYFLLPAYFYQKILTFELFSS